MPERQEVTLEMNVRDTIVTMAEGNIGAAIVLARLATNEGGGTLFDVFHLDDMNMRGIQVWIAYKYWAHEDMESFVGAVRRRDLTMIAYVNHEGREGSHAWLAVPHWHHDGHRRRIA